MSRTYEAFAQDCLAAIGNLAPLQGTLDFVCGWMGCESGGSGGAANNPLNCTLVQAGSTQYNTAGVQNYQTWSGGVVATVTTLRNGLYPDLLAALELNEIQNLVGPSAGVNADLSMWSAGSYTANDYYCGRQFYSDGGKFLASIVAGAGPGGNPAPTGGPPATQPPPAGGGGIPGWFSGIASWIQNALNPRRWLLALLGIGLITAGAVLFMAEFLQSDAGQTAVKTAAAAA